MSIEQRLERIEQLIEQSTLLLGVKDVLNVAEAAAYTGLSKDTIYRLVSQRKIPYYKSDGAGVSPGKYTYFDKAELREWLKKHRVPTNEEVQEQAAAYVLNTSRRGRPRRAAVGSATGERGGVK